MKNLFVVLSVLALVSCLRQTSTLFIGYHGNARVYEISCSKVSDCEKHAKEACPGEKVTVGNPNSTRYWVECVK